ncbi:MAG TPA: redoxin family protein [Bacteroidia bacterium]|nr:redoxin family protein [Bacteroidia bacterium]
MKKKFSKKIFLLLILTGFISLQCFSQNVPMIKVTDLLKRIKSNNDTTYIVNFWATWCVPCVREMPNFEKINEEYKNEKVKVLLVSINFPNELDSLVIPYVKRKKIKSEVMLLNELNMDYFVPLVSPKWHYADIPATLFVNNKNNVYDFYQKEMTLDFLEEKIKEISK